MKTNIKLLFIFLLIIGIIFVIGCISQSGEIIKTPIELCKERYSSDEDAYSCITGVAIDEKNPAICRELTDFELRNGCYRDTARRLENPTMCDYMETPSGKAWCLSQVGIVAMDMGICEMISADELALKDECFCEVGFRTVNLRSCAMVSNERLKDYCYAVSSKSEHYIDTYCEKHGRGWYDEYGEDYIEKCRERIMGMESYDGSGSAYPSVCR
jgi:hypothetical protein